MSTPTDCARCGHTATEHTTPDELTDGVHHASACVRCGCIRWVDPDQTTLFP